MTEEAPNQAEYDAHRLMKLLRKVADDGQFSNDIERVIVPEKSFAELLRPLIREDIAVLAPVERDKFWVSFDGHESVIWSHSVDDATTLDLRLAHVWPGGSL